MNGLTSDAAILARFHYLLGNLLFPLGRLDECRVEHEKAQAHARAAGLVAFEAQALSRPGDAAYAHRELVTARSLLERCPRLAQADGLDEIYAVNHRAGRLRAGRRSSSGGDDRLSQRLPCCNRAREARGGPRETLAEPIEEGRRLGARLGLPRLEQTIAQVGPGRPVA